MSQNRRHAIALAVIALVGLVRALYWVATTEVWYPIDEAQHYAYVQSVASGQGIPVAGVDRVPLDVLRVAKASPTWWYRHHPLQINSDDPEWEIMAEQYEAIQPPLYYFLMAGPYRLFRPRGVIASIYALRVGSVLLSLLAIPLAWWLARRLFPKRPAVWLATPAMLVVIQGFNSNFASGNNDSLLFPLSIAALIPVTRPGGLKMKGAVATGVILGAAFLTKMTAVVILPILAAALLFLALRRGRVLRVIAWGAVAMLIAGALLAPWLIRNQRVYGTPTGSEAAAAITDAAQFTLPLTREGMTIRARLALKGFFEIQEYGYGWGPYVWTFLAAAAVALLVGVAVAWKRKERAEARALIWMAITFPLGFLTMLALVYGVFGGRGAAVGRHLNPALVPVVLLIAAGMLIGLGTRRGILALALVGALALVLEWRAVPGYIETVYASGTLEHNLVPVVDQSWNDEYVPARGLAVEPPCPVEVVGLGLNGQTPALSVSGPFRGNLTFWRFAFNLDHVGDGRDSLSLYRLPTPTSARFELRLPPGQTVGQSRTEREGAVSFVGQEGDPMAALYCPVSNPIATRFAQRFSPLHPQWITYKRAVAWPLGWALAGIALLASLVGYMIRARF